jgi:zinc and cadmium transporter
MLQVVFFSLIGGLFSLIGGIILIKNKKTADGLAKYATPFAAGVLLAAAFTDLLPEAIHDNESQPILLAALFGLLGFFFLERFLSFFHHHHAEDAKSKSSSALIVIGDTLHNALDGVAIGAAFLISPSTGIVATIAVAAHEIPQEIGDFGLLLKNGMKKGKVILVNVLSALATTIAAVLTFGLANQDSSYVPFLLAITAGFFIYIAASDIIPGIHDASKSAMTDIRPWLLLLGALLIMVISPLAHGYIDAGYDDVHSHRAGEDKHYHEDEEKHEDAHEDEDEHKEKHKEDF